MNSLSVAVNNFARDPENSELNYDVANEYFNIGQTAAAISYYLRTAERTSDKNLAYECMLRIAQCFDKQGDRHNSVRGAYKHALLICPNRPEAYFLLANFNYNVNWTMEAYTNAQQGLNFSAFDLPPLRTDVGYPGEYGLIFYKAIAGWWWGKSGESRETLKHLIDNYYDSMTDNFKEGVRNNISRLGISSETQALRTYGKSKHNKLRYKFKGSEDIERNYSQVYQDMFVLSMLDGKRNGTYLEVGSSEPFHNNNTALLEKQYNWRGTGIEIDSKCIPAYTQNRTNKVLCQDALQTNYKSILKEIAVDGVVDYLQLDCEPTKATFEVLLSIPFDEYKFAVITYEHDHAIDLSKSYRTKSRNYLKLMGYVLVANDISADGISTFEDWWVHPDLIDKSILDKMQVVDENIKHVEKYMLVDSIDKSPVPEPVAETSNVSPYLIQFGKFSNGVNSKIINNIEDWSELSYNDVITILREIGNEDVYGYWRNVKEGDVVVDVGSCIGPFVCTTLEKQPSSVYCIEPSKKLITSLKNNVEKFNTKSTPVHYINKAIVGQYDDVNAFAKEESIETTTFMEMVKENNIDRINFLKIDCEGGEYSIFADDSIEFLLDNVEYIAMEVHLNYDRSYRERFKQFRDKYLVRFEDYKVVSCTTQKIDWGKNVDLKPMIFDDAFIDTYDCEFMIYIWNHKNG
jgi:FkbM family methyltransferase